MHRLTKLEIQRALLAGSPVTWTNAAGKAELLQLGTAPQRRLFAHLLGSSVREPKGLSDDFIRGLAGAYAEEDDPADQQAAVGASAATTGPWRLQAIETVGFGGINTCNGPVFTLELDAESFILQGPNGSGKSSLVGAILWAITGDRPRDHSNAKPEDRADVFNQDSRAIGTWPPVACYPDDPAGLAANPHVRVTLTFVDPHGNKAVVERQLKDGLISEARDPAFNPPDILIETGLLMPSRMAQIRLEKGPTRLTSAVQSLTGLDDLVDLGLLADGLCHKGREYLSTNAKELDRHKALFDAALAEAGRALQPTDEAIGAFKPKDTEDTSGPLAALGKRLKERAAELTQVIADDLTAGLELTNAKVQQDVAGAISGAREDLALGLDALPSWKALSQLAAAISPEGGKALAAAAAAAEESLAEALALNERAKLDTRLQLKALGAHWHEAHRHDAVVDCPLCDKPLEDSSLRTEIESLRRSGEASTRRLADNINAIQAQLEAAVPAVLVGKLGDFGGFTPRQKVVEDLTERFVTRDRYSRHLASFTRLVIGALAKAPAADLTASAGDGKIDGASTDADAVRARIVMVCRLVELANWFREQAPGWHSWWASAVGKDSAALENQDSTSPAAPQLAARAEPARETFEQHLRRLSDAIGEATPYRAAAEALGRAWKSGRDARSFEKEQERRESIAAELAPLKMLGGLAEAQARLAIEDLSEDIAEILRRIHLNERLTFKGANLQRKTGLLVHAGFENNLKIDATLVANTSWLRAVLWAFLFALRKEAVKQLGRNPFPVLVLDDPQATFDAEHRHRWANEIVSLQEDATPVQIILATHDETFLELVKIDRVQGREAIIVAAGPELGHAGIFEGAALDRQWAKTQLQNTPAAGQDYISAVRVYVEGLLRLMLRGESAGVASVTSGFVLGDSRKKLRDLHDAGLAPWDKPEFKSLFGQLDQGIAAIKHLEMSHHAGRIHLAMSEATDVELHWRKKLSPALGRAFHLAREHQLLHGGLKALQAAEPSCALPDGYSDKVRGLRMEVLGRAAALSGGLAADGRVSLTFGGSAEKIVLGRHSAFRLNAPTLEPVARKGDILLVQDMGEPSSRSLVVARCEDRVVARRFEIAQNHSDVAVLTAQAVNPRQIAPPIVVKKATLSLHKIIGVLFDHRGASMPGEAGEVCDCGGESELHRFTSSVEGLVEIAGHSAEPIALDGQLLLIGSPVSAADALSRLQGRPVIAGDANENRYFKRLRIAGANSVILESLEISGDLEPVLMTHATGAATDLTQVWPVLGVLFERSN